MLAAEIGKALDRERLTVRADSERDRLSSGTAESTLPLRATEVFRRFAGGSLFIMAGTRQQRLKVKLRHKLTTFASNLVFPPNTRARVCLASCATRSAIVPRWLRNPETCFLFRRPR